MSHFTDVAGDIDDAASNSSGSAKSCVVLLKRENFDEIKNDDGNRSVAHSTRSRRNSKLTEENLAAHTAKRSLRSNSVSSDGGDSAMTQTTRKTRSTAANTPKKVPSSVRPATPSRRSTRLQTKNDQNFDSPAKLTPAKRSLRSKSLASSELAGQSEDQHLEAEKMPRNEATELPKIVEEKVDSSNANLSQSDTPDAEMNHDVNGDTGASSSNSKGSTDSVSTNIEEQKTPRNETTKTPKVVKEKIDSPVAITPKVATPSTNVESPSKSAVAKRNLRSIDMVSTDLVGQSVDQNMEEERTPRNETTKTPKVSVEKIDSPLKITPKVAASSSTDDSPSKSAVAKRNLRSSGIASTDLVDQNLDEEKTPRNETPKTAKIVVEKIDSSLSITPKAAVPSATDSPSKSAIAKRNLRSIGMVSTDSVGQHMEEEKTSKNVVEKIDSSLQITPKPTAPIDNSPFGTPYPGINREVNEIINSLATPHAHREVEQDFSDAYNSLSPTSRRLSMLDQRIEDIASTLTPVTSLPNERIHHVKEEKKAENSPKKTPNPRKAINLKNELSKMFSSIEKSIGKNNTPLAKPATISMSMFDTPKVSATNSLPSKPDEAAESVSPMQENIQTAKPNGTDEMADQKDKSLVNDSLSDMVNSSLPSESTSNSVAKSKRKSVAIVTPKVIKSPSKIKREDTPHPMKKEPIEKPQNGEDGENNQNGMFFLKGFIHFKQTHSILTTMVIVLFIGCL